MTYGDTEDSIEETLYIDESENLAYIKSNESQWGKSKYEIENGVKITSFIFTYLQMMGIPDLDTPLLLLNNYRDIKVMESNDNNLNCYQIAIDENVFVLPIADISVVTENPTAIIYVDKKTNIITKLILNLDGNFSVNNNKMSILNITVDYSKFNETESIQIPQEVIDSAVEQ